MLHSFLLGTGALSFGLGVLYYLWVFFRSTPKRAVYLLTSALCGGCFVFFAERIHPLSTTAERWLLWGGVVTGLVVVASLYSYESQRVR